MISVTLRDDQWSKIRDFLSALPEVYVGQEADCRRFLEAVLWITRTGAQWRALPERYGKWNTVYKRFLRWCEKGVWTRLHEAFADDPDMEFVLLDSSVVRAHPCAAGAPEKKGGQAAQALGRSRGGFSSKIHISVDALGNPLRIQLTGGQTHDITQAEALLPEEPFEHLLADTAYDAEAFVQVVEARGATPVIPPRSNRKTPRTYDADLYKERHVVECFFNKIKQYRRIFSRFEKLGMTFRGFLHFVSVLIWLK